MLFGAEGTANAGVVSEAPMSDALGSTAQMRWEAQLIGAVCWY